jgi:putative transposase
MSTQFQLLGMACSSLDDVLVQETAVNARVKRLLDELYLREHCLVSRKLVTVLERYHSVELNRKRVQSLRWEMVLEAIY